MAGASSTARHGQRRTPPWTSPGKSRNRVRLLVEDIREALGSSALHGPFPFGLPLRFAPSHSRTVCALPGARLSRAAGRHDASRRFRPAERAECATTQPLAGREPLRRIHPDRAYRSSHPRPAARSFSPVGRSRADRDRVYKRSRRWLGNWRLSAACRYPIAIQGEGIRREG